MFYLPGQKRGYGDSHRGGHGWTDLRKSIYDSVNTYYYKLALDMGIARVDQYMGHYGFGGRLAWIWLAKLAESCPHPSGRRKTRPSKANGTPAIR